jgi:hypothetical protein
VRTSVRQAGGVIVAYGAGVCLALASAHAGGPARPGVAMGAVKASDSQRASPAQPATKQDVAVARHETKHFVILHAHGERWATGMGAALERIYARFLPVSATAGFAVHAPTGPLTWLCFRDGDARDLYDAAFEGDGTPSFKSFYSSRTDQVLLLGPAPLAEAGLSPEPTDPSARPPATDAIRIAHEMAHQLSYHTGLQTRGVMYPLWVSEGLAMLYETALLSPDGFQADNPLRRVRLQEARDGRRLWPLKDFVTMTQSPADEETRSDFYAQAWGLANLMMRRDRPGFARYLALLGQLEGGRRPEAALAREFESAFGDPAAFDRAWQEYLAEGLAPPDDATIAPPARPPHGG